MKYQKNIGKLACSFVGVILLLNIPSYVGAAEEDSSFWGADLSLGTAHQEYNSATADMNSLSITPYVLAAGWEISISLPWYNIDGNYFTNGKIPRVVDACQRLLGLSEARQQRLIRRGIITQNQLNACQTAVDELEAAEASASGIGDLDFYANYLMNFTETGSWWGGVGLGYSMDNGDYEKGLGKGSRDTSIQLSLGSSIGKWQTQLMLGYVSVEATDTTDEIDDYAQASMDVAYAMTDWFTLGTNYSIEESYIVDGDEIKTLMLYGDFSLNEKWKLHVYASNYAEVKSYPETEIGASILFGF